MAYNKANHFKKIIEIQNIVLSEQKKDNSKYLKTIYFEKIEPVYFISYRTFHNYLGINAKAELKKLERQKEASKTAFYCCEFMDFKNIKKPCLNQCTYCKSI